MQKEEAVTGIIGFFDILGYQSFILNNEPEIAAQEVFSTLMGIDKIVKKYIAEKLAHTAKTWIKEIQWLVFSDTILITISLPQPENTPTSLQRWVKFLVASGFLQRHMFEFGLPLRGAITTGKFIVRGNCFAGRPIMDGYQLSQNIDLAATIFSPSAYKQLFQLLQNIEQLIGEAKPHSDFKTLRRFIESITPEYLVPFETMPEERRMTLDFLAFPTTGQKPTPDVAQFVFEAFWKHNKDIPSHASTKARNTEQYLRFLEYKHPERL